jgi:N-acetylmuramoyl-L-alanine amidase
VKPEVTHIVPSSSSREGSRPTIIVLHTTEGHNRPGVGDLVDLGNFFANIDNEASSHVANDAEGHDARFVADADKAWTCAGFNRVSLNIEQVAFAATTKADWFEHHSHQLANTAKWIAFWAGEYGIPIRRGVISGSIVVKSGVVGHKQLGATGGGHVDPGAPYPFDYVIELARVFKLPRGAEKTKALGKVNRVRKHYGLKPIRGEK